MKSREVNGSVIWRLPQSGKVSTLVSGIGDDKFIIAPFDKGREYLQLNGAIREVDNQQVHQFFSDWQPGPANDRSSVAKDDYMSWVAKARQKIIDGKFVKVVLAQKQFVEAGITTAELFQALLDHYPDAMVYAFRTAQNQYMLGASPETLLYRHDDVLYTEALGGTRTAGLYSDKELEEHEHIRQYISNILDEAHYEFHMGSTGTRQAGSVEHLKTQYSLISKSAEQDLQLAFILHPTSAVCGMPYREAFEFIKQTEGFDRSYYSGFLGPVKSNGNFSLHVNLRCAQLYKDGLTLYAGAGLNEMSDPLSEWEETMNKMTTIGQWLK